MKSDPIVDEVRRVRHDIERMCGSDRDAYYRHVRKIQKALSTRVVCRKPRRLTVSMKKVRPG